LHGDFISNYRWIDEGPSKLNVKLLCSFALHDPANGPTSLGTNTVARFLI
jgi:hypothetical protein